MTFLYITLCSLQAGPYMAPVLASRSKRKLCRCWGTLRQSTRWSIRKQWSEQPASSLRETPTKTELNPHLYRFSNTYSTSRLTVNFFLPLITFPWCWHTTGVNGMSEKTNLVWNCKCFHIALPLLRLIAHSKDETEKKCISDLEKIFSKSDINCFLSCV